jgi:hydrogenase maturation protease
MDKKFRDRLAHFITGRVCLLGIGNRFWKDDGVGSYIAGSLKSSQEFANQEFASQEFFVIDAGYIPENHLETVARKKPDTILMVDATDFGGIPGQVKLLYPDKVAYSGLSTHAGSLRMLAEYLHARTQASIALVAIQPADSSAGEGLSPVVSKTLNELVEFFQEVFSTRPHVSQQPELHRHQTPSHQK